MTSFDEAIDVSDLGAGEDDRTYRSLGAVDETIQNAVQADIIPRLLSSIDVSALKPWSRSPVPLADALLAPQPDAAWRLVRDMIEQGAPLDQIYHDRITAAAHALGVMWETDQISFADVTVGASRLHLILNRLSPVFRMGAKPGGVGRKALFAVTPGESHALGVTMIADHFARAGFSVEVDLGPTRSSLVEKVSTEGIALVGLSAATARILPKLRETIHAIRKAADHDPVVLVGGFAFASGRGADTPVDADAIINDPNEAVALAESLLDCGVSAER